MLKRFFLNCNTGISRARVKQIVNKHGKDVLIGIDPGSSDTPDENALATINAIKEVGAKLHVYLVGPGMMSWSAEERAQIRYLARSVGIDTTNSNWHTIWTKTGWKKKNLQQFNYYFRKFNAYSCEIDNIDSSYIQNDPEETVKFYTELKNSLATHSDGPIKTKLMIKNLDEDQLKAVIDAGFSTDFLCEWGMFEDGSGSPKKQFALCKKINIFAVTPLTGITDTHSYGTVTEGVPYL